MQVRSLVTSLSLDFFFRCSGAPQSTPSKEQSSQSNKTRTCSSVMPNSISSPWFPLWEKGTQSITNLTLYPEWLVTKQAMVVWDDGLQQHGRWEHVSELGGVWGRERSHREQPELYSKPAANLLCDLEHIAWSLWVLAPISVKWGNQDIFSLRLVPVLRFYGFISEELIWKDMKDSEINNEERTFLIKC